MNKNKNNNYIYYPVKKFIEEYRRKKQVRLHMPGHKGAYGYEDDITEVKGADSLYEADGIIAESEKRASELFGSAYTFYSTEGSSQVIKAMCYLAMQRYFNSRPDTHFNKSNTIVVASRNAHKSFIYASMLLGFKIMWLEDEGEYSLCKCEISPDGLDNYLKNLLLDFKSKEKSEEKSDDKSENNTEDKTEDKIEDNTRSVDNQNEKQIDVVGVYITSPDYLGNMLDIEGLAQVAHKYNLPLLVDNAHGSYLKFMESDMHPVSLGADIVADSAHKTLPVLTGGAYLHVSKSSILLSSENEVRKALLMFGSTSPSYMILESLDEALGRIDRDKYIKTQEIVRILKKEIIRFGYDVLGVNPECSEYQKMDNKISALFEPLKLVIDMRRKNMTGVELAERLRNKNIECEYADPDFLVTMWSPFNEYPGDYDRFKDAMLDISKDISGQGSVEKTIDESNKKISFSLPEVKYQPCEVTFLPHESVKAGPELIGRVAADTAVSCPPAVSPIVAGEIIDEKVIKILEYYGIEMVEVLT